MGSMRCLGRPGEENQQENRRKAPGWTSKQDIRERGGPRCPMRYQSQSPFSDSQYQGSSNPILFSAAHSVLHRRSFFFHSRECRGRAWESPRQPPVFLLPELSGKASGAYLLHPLLTLEFLPPWLMPLLDLWSTWQGDATFHLRGFCEPQAITLFSSHTTVLYFPSKPC